MGKKKKNDKDAKVKTEIVSVERRGRCLKCNKPMVKNHLSCNQCNRKKRLISKANRRGKSKRHYL